MKIFRSESLVDYATYTFNYATYCIKEKQDELPDIYEQGFLPYSNDTSLEQEIFYLARSLRVDLDRFRETSENRRVIRKISPLKPAYKLILKSDFDVHNPEFQSFCLAYAEKRFSEPINLNRLQYILNSKSISHIFEFEMDRKKIGYVITIIEKNTLHYWFSFFDLDYQNYALGKFMMFSVIEWASKNNLEYVYLGTCYGERSLYKVRDFNGLSFFDGNQWNRDLKLLKYKCKNDAKFTTDYFKQDSDLFLENLES